MQHPNMLQSVLQLQNCCQRACAMVVCAKHGPKLLVAKAAAVIATQFEGLQHTHIHALFDAALHSYRLLQDVDDATRQVVQQEFIKAHVNFVA